MMDFLRRLAPRREADLTRAFAVLPSRFAGETPLQATLAPGRMARHPDDDEASLSPNTASASAPAANDTLAAQAHRVTSTPLFQATPRPLAGEPTPGLNREATSPARVPGNEKATLPAYAPAEAPGIHVVNSRAVQGRHDANDERAKSANPEPHGLAATSDATRAFQNANAPPAQTRLALPLSQAILAQRTRDSRDHSQVVHVTIGRIEVVATAAPAPATRRSTAPRQGTVTLADYLRGSKGSRQ